MVKRQARQLGRLKRKDPADPFFVKRRKGPQAVPRDNRAMLAFIREKKVGKPKPPSRVLKPRKSGAKPKAKHHLGAGKPKPTSLVLKPRSSGAGPKTKHHKGVKQASRKKVKQQEAQGRQRIVSPGFFKTLKPKKGRRKSAMDIMSGAKKSA